MSTHRRQTLAEHLDEVYCTVQPNEPAHGYRRYPCCGAWWEDGCQCGSDSENILHRRTSARPYAYDGTYDLREDECPDCGFDIPSGLCDCRPGVPSYTNADRMEDVESGHLMRDGGSLYTDDGS